MNRARAASWAFAIGTLSVVLATLLFRFVPMAGPLYIVLLIWSVGLLAALAGVIAEITPRTGAIGGAIAVCIVLVIFAMTVATAPLEPGARRPGFADMLWTPLLALIAIFGVCAVVGFYGARLGLHLAHRRRPES